MFESSSTAHRSEETSAVDLAVDQLATALDHLVKVVEDGGLDGHDAGQFVTFLQGFERVRNRLPLIDHRALRDAGERDLAGHFLHRSLSSFLATTLRLSPGDAVSRVQAAEQVGDRVSMLGERLAPVRPALAAAQRAGDVTPEHVQIIQKALGKVDRAGFDPADIEAGERLLTGHAQTFGPKDLRQLAEKVVDAINPDGTLPDEQLNRDRRHFRLRQNRDGSYSGEFRLTGPVGAKLSAMLSPLTAPKTTKLAGRDGVERPVPDDRTYGQRTHDAVEEVCDRLLRAGTLPDSGGTPATVIVTIDYDGLLARTGFGETSDGTLLSAAEVLRLAREADILPTVLSKSGALLDLGRSRRLATANQTCALIARDGGCSFPGCTHPPEWCERHHIVGWIEGGKTSVTNLTLLCGYHHANFVQRGWRCQLNGDGLPEWIPPRWVDPQQRPQLNHRILRRRKEAELARGATSSRVDQCGNPREAVPPLLL